MYNLGLEEASSMTGESSVSPPHRAPGPARSPDLQAERTCCYEALLLDEERGRLFVGAENHVASLSLDNISKRAKKVPETPPPPSLSTSPPGKSPGEVGSPEWTPSA